jgi:uncharacterized protein Yka (UPF0111/DUF47 family)
MTSKKISTLIKLLDDEKILKMAQEIGAGEGEIDQVAADKMADQIFDQLFDDELKKLINQS